MIRLLKLLLVIVCLCYSPVWGSDTLYIHYLDVGQGDATLVVSPTGEIMLVDAGYNGKGESKILPFLEDRSITSLDYIVATHYHADHIGGIDEVIDGLSIDSVGIVYDRGWSYTTQTYTDYANVVQSIRTTIQDSQVIDLGGGVEVTCVAVNGNAVLDNPFTDPPHNENDLCVALKLSYTNFEFFVAGDLSGKNTDYYTDIETSVAPEVGRIEVLQVDHHGSNNNTNQCFLDSLQPQVAIISVGDNPYGHPHPEVIERLEAVPSVIYQTEDGDGNVVDGDITIKVCSDSFWVNGDGYATSVGVEEDEQTGVIPKGFGLLQNYPNPFNSSTTICYTIPDRDREGRPHRTTLKVYNILGQEVGALVGEKQSAGYYQVLWNGRDNSGKDISSGIYFYRLQVGDFVQTRKMVVLK